MGSTPEGASGAASGAAPATTRDGEALIRVEGASKIYRMGEVDVPALKDVTLDLRRGELLVVIGPSGCGKSTLLNIVGGMDRPTSGSVWFEGHDLARAGEGELTRYRRHQVGFVFQFYNLVPTLTALENVEVATEVARDPLAPREALELVGLADRADHFPAQLSGGQQQRVSIARALAGQPRLILCDEPTGALDQQTSRQVLALLTRLASERGKTVVLITHNHAIASIGDRVVSLRDGEVTDIATQTPTPIDAVAW